MHVGITDGTTGKAAGEKTTRAPSSGENRKVSHLERHNVSSLNQGLSHNGTRFMINVV